MLAKHHSTSTATLSGVRATHSVCLLQKPVFCFVQSHCLGNLWGSNTRPARIYSSYGMQIVVVGLRLTIACLLQFAEIVFTAYEDDYKLAGLLAGVTLISCFMGVFRLFQSRMKLYESVCRRRLVPIVQGGRVR